MAGNLICWDIATGIWDAMFSPASAGAAVWLACRSQREKLFKTLPFCRTDFFRRQTQTELLGCFCPEPSHNKREAGEAKKLFRHVEHPKPVSSIFFPFIRPFSHKVRT
ncbi:hypothetical protein NBRC3257_2705 [Gluconobacter thailandicus NBRC 3257]|uniref:Secreted protein n=1 Tax=Gluconobacter thailandicus NBRC 3257 TaxID=1381097 RepID=A0ABQ0IZS1_GLUTH|nr:hypothetical protein AD946_11005 [Gluconobacter thailandicus]GAD27706.1 hypothetical protein NBRC3257_2705 [Gluconobacter thailandicus NBRC 3257]